MIDHVQFPRLFAQYSYGVIRAQFERLDKLPPAEKIGNISIVPFVGDNCVIIQLENGVWETPGGTLEPGEHYLDAARRELLEEAGARLIDFHLFGMWNCQSLADQPYRAHLPHPHFCRLVGYADVEIVSMPLNPPDGEQVVQVAVVSVDEAAGRFSLVGRDDLADLYRLAESLHNNGATYANF